MLHAGSINHVNEPKDLKFLKKKITCEYLAEDDELSRGDCSIIKEDYDEASDIKANSQLSSNNFSINVL